MRGLDNVVFGMVKEMYFYSDVGSGEFIHSAKVHAVVNNQTLLKEEVIQGIQNFLNWDESPETFDVIRIGKFWFTTDHIQFDDWVEYKGIRYPIRHLTVEHCDLDGDVNYTIAPECLIDAMQSADGELAEDEEHGYLFDDIDLEGFNIDNKIYHYVEDAVWHLTGKEIAEKHLDMPFVFIEE